MDGTPLFDATLVEGRTLFVFEYKGGAVPAPVKHSFDPDKLLREIDRKYVGDRSKRKGVGQLAHGILRVSQADELAALTRGTPVEAIQPILVSLDSAITAPLVCKYLEEECGRNIKTLMRCARSDICWL
ncbi:MAG: hypothetical protein U0Q16_33955 [Bryobacteraceae bacterium]